LFGAGMIGHIPVQVLEEVAAAQARLARKEDSQKANPVPSGSLQPGFIFGFPPVASPMSGGSADSVRHGLPISGRVARLKDGRVGRFGWKNQIATLREFTLQACALELGLEVPGFPQTTPPWKPDYKAPGLDLSADQCDALVKFVASLPPPRPKPPETDLHAAEITAGQLVFERIGCATCHRPKLGDVEGIYSDLLLHDMGDALSDSGQYGGSILADEETGDQIQLPVVKTLGDNRSQKKPKFGASSREWRTPPLWGLRDSAPYLHDGRAETISAAVSFHGGEGFDSAQLFQRLSVRERQQIELFLESSVAPAQE
jgi:CxxC motif-containing protein (DUF1111 family)